MSCLIECLCISRGLGTRRRVYANNPIHGGSIGPCGCRLREATWMISYAYMTDSNQSPGHQGLVSFPGWQYSMHVVTHHCLEKCCCTTPLAENNWKIAPGRSWTLPCESLDFFDFSLYPFAVLNCNHEYNGFSVFCESFQ